MASDLDRRLRGFQANVWQDEPAEWFAKRGIEYSIVEKFRLGFTGSKRVRSPAGLDLRRCLVFPYEDGLGRVRALRYRPLYDGAAAKYLGDSPSHLFAVRAADNPTVYITEGEMDTLIAWQLGFKAVGLPGAQNFRPAWRYIFRAPHVDRVVLALDPDKAGREAAVKLYGLLKEVTDVSAVNLPEGLDLNDTFLKYGEKAVREALLEGVK